MSRRFLALLAGVVALGVSHTAARAVPDFSGRWVLSEGAPGGFATPFVVTQDANVATLTPAGAARGWRVYLDGRTTTSPFTVPTSPPPASVEPNKVSYLSGTSELVLRGAWAADQLVVVSHYDLYLNPNNPATSTLGRATTDNRIEYTNRFAFSLDALDRLRIETLALADPLPSKTPINSPAAVVRLYKRAQ